MKKFIEEFKAFAIQGNVIDLAVAVVVGTAFGRITTSFVNNIIMPLFGGLMGGIDFSNQSFMLRGSEVTYGVFIQSVVEFLIIAFAVFVAVKLISNFKQKEKEEIEEKGSSEETLLLREIRDSLKK